MKTQTLASLLFTFFILLFSTRINSHGNVTEPAQAAFQSIQSITAIATNNTTEAPHQIDFVLTEPYHGAHGHGSDDDSHFLHFHFSRISRNRKYYQARIITYKLILVIVHIVLLTLH